MLLALAGFDAALFAALAALGIAAIGRWGALLPWVVYLGSTEALSRLTRLRPELLALLLLLAAAWFAGRGAYRRLGLVAALYALSYSAIHAFAGLMFAAFLLFAWRAEAADRALLLDGVDGSGHCRSTPCAGSDWVSFSTRAFPPTSPDWSTRRASAWAARRSPVQAPSWGRIRSRSLSSLSSGAWWRLSSSGWRDDRPTSARRTTLPETCTTSPPAT